MSLVADLRMKALRFEEKENWQDAAAAWHRAIDALQEMSGAVVAALHHEFQSRALAAEARADEPLGQAQPWPKVEANAADSEKSPEDREPGAVTHLEAGENLGSSGAR